MRFKNKVKVILVGHEIIYIYIFVSHRLSIQILLPSFLNYCLKYSLYIILLYQLILVY